MPEIEEEVLKIDYDSHWKEIIGEFFEDFTAFFMPDLHEKADFTRPVDFLEQELLDIFKTKYKGKHINDKLVKVYLKDGTEKWILIHIEVQATFEKEFAKRMFLYYALIYTKYEIEDITAIAIFTNPKVPKNHNHYKHSLFGTTISYQYNSYKIRDQKEAELLKSKNPFALAVLANLYVLKTNQKYDKRLIQKEKLFEIAKRVGYDEKKLIRLLIFVKNLMVLPEDLEFKFTSHIKSTLQNENLMLLNEEDKKFLTMIYEAISGETPQEMAERMKISSEEAKAKRTIIRYYQKNQFEGLADLCEALEVDYLFAEAIITEYLNEKNKA